MRHPAGTIVTGVSSGELMGGILENSGAGLERFFWMTGKLLEIFCVFRVFLG